MLEILSVSHKMILKLLLKRHCKKNVRKRLGSSESEQEIIEKIDYNTESEMKLTVSDQKPSDSDKENDRDTCNK